jgi:hypothetical protein
MNTATAPAAKKITLATVKTFIRTNKARLQISTQSAFNGMTDGVESCADRSFSPVQEASFANQLGIAGAWFVFGSRDYFSRYEDNGMVGIRVYNCCGSFVLAVPA